MSSYDAPQQFSNALDSFKRRLNSQEKEHFELGNLQDLKLAISNIQKEQAQRHGFRNLNKIRPVVDFLQNYARVIEQFVSAKPDFLAFIWVASRATDAFDSLLDAYARIGESLPLIEAIDQIFHDQSNDYIQQILVNIYEDILTFHSRALVFFKQRTWKIAFKTTFRTFNDIYGDVVKNLARSRDLLIQSASVQHFKEAQDARTFMHRDYEEQKYRDEKNKTSFVADWLSHVSCDEQHQKIRDKIDLYPKSTNWILNQTQVVDWIRGSATINSTLWVSGIPGAGKTFLFSSIVEEIKANIPDAHVIYFYCTYNDPSKTTFSDMVRSLIAQMLDFDSACLQYLYDTMISSVRRHPGSTNTLCAEMIKSIALHHEHLFIGIDGLDECDVSERKQVLSMVNSIVRSSQDSGNVRFFLFSRMEKDIKQGLSSTKQLEIQPHHLEKDIRDYLLLRMRGLGRKFGLLVARQKSIIEQLAARSNGMFLLARLIMDNLIDQDCTEDLEIELADTVLPRGIDQAYARIVARMRKKDGKDCSRRWDRAKRGLDALAVATRPLKVHELQGMLSIRLEDRSIAFEARKARTPLEELLGPLIEIHRDRTVNFIHPTARDYLCQHHSDYYVNTSAANSGLALLCTSYLTFPCFTPDASNLDIKHSMYNGDYALQEYATFAVLNQRHAQESGRLMPEAGSEGLVTGSCDISGALDYCQNLYEKASCISFHGVQVPLPYLLHRLYQVRCILEQLSPQSFETSPILREAYGDSLYKCAMVQCDRFLRGFASRVLRDDHWKRVHDRVYKCTHESCDFASIAFATSIDLARHEELCHYEHDPICSFPKVKQVSLYKALKDAIDRDDALVVQDIYAELILCPTTETGFLYRAAKRRSWKATSVILENFSSPEQLQHTSDDGRTVLHEVLHARDVDLIRKILGAGVHVNAKDSKGRTPLSEALALENFDAVGILIRYPDVLFEFDTNDFTAVFASKKALLAISCGTHKDIMQTVIKALLKSYPSVGRVNRLLSLSVCQALTRAASENKQAVFDLLIDLGRETNLEECYIKRLKAAIAKGIEAVKSEVPEIDHKGKTKGNVLAQATKKGDLATVSRLLEKGADANFSSQYAYSPLNLASKAGNVSMVRLLLGAGADVNHKGSYSGSALHVAAFSRHYDTVEVLLDHGADVNALSVGIPRADGTSLHETYSANALYAASKGGNDLVVQLLLTKGADINQECGDHGSALQVASFCGHEDVVRLLVDAGANVNTQNTTRASSNFCGNALQAASKEEHFSIVQYLIDSGANPNLKSGGYGTALQAAAVGKLALARRSNLKMVELLLENGAEINTRCGQFGNALQAACHSNHADIVAVLLENGADVNARSGAYGNALEAALTSVFGPACKDVIDALLAHGADVTILSQKARDKLDGYLAISHQPQGY
ncbi:hypothetical protein ACLMJK_000545 [Lecanora helva]